MSLIINKQIATPTGFDVSNICVRLEVTHHLCGDKVKVTSKEYASKAAFDNGAQPIENNFVNSNVFEYERAADGADVLQFAHEQFKQYIIDTYKTEPIIEKLPKLDENNEPVLDADGNDVLVDTTTGTTYFFTDLDIEIVI